MDQMKTGGLIRTLRRRRGLTQLALAERLGVSDKAVSKWERGRGAPDIALLPYRRRWGWIQKPSSGAIWRKMK